MRPALAALTVACTTTIALAAPATAAPAAPPYGMSDMVVPGESARQPGGRRSPRPRAAVATFLPFLSRVAPGDAPRRW
ncbi:hypothetical protein JCM9533A_66350 [Catenuloplanes niger JCM 9533]